jgi:hypothetical protein
MSISLKNREWEEFYLKDIFVEIQRGRRLKKDDHIKGSMPYVSSSGINNAVDNFVNNKDKVRIFHDCLTIANSGSVGVSFYHSYKFVASDHVTKLRNEAFNKYIYLFISSIVSRLSEKYGFNREINDKRILREKILLPVDKNKKPDYSFMEEYMREKEKEKLRAYQIHINKKLNSLKPIRGGVESLSHKEWGEFFIENIAEIIGGKDIYGTERIDGCIPYVSATALKNGIGYFIGNKNTTLEKNCLSVNRNGSVGYTFYHPYSALFSNDCRKLRLKNPSKYSGLFIAQQITSQKGKYGYGYKMGTARLKRQKVMLPVLSDNQPDYEYMENYMKNIEYKKLQKYMEYVER